MTTNNITVVEAAFRMGVTPTFLRYGLQQQRFPFGAAVKMTRWSYYINPIRFEKYLNGTDDKREEMHK